MSYPPPPTPETLQKPVLRLLRPLVRLLIRSGITFPALCDMLRELYVNVAEYDLTLPDKAQTNSRVSLLTGIHRKEVRRLRDAGAPLRDVPATLSRTSRIVARWLGGPPYSDETGAALPLARTAAEGPSFEALVGSVTRDVRPRAILDEWLDRQLVAMDPDGRVVLLEAGVVPRGGDEAQLYYFGRNLHDHLAAATSNVLGAGPPFLERSVHYDGLSEALARHLGDRSRELALQALQRLNVEAQAALAGDAGGPWRWTFGTFVYAETEPQAPAREGVAAETQAPP